MRNHLVPALAAAILALPAHALAQSSGSSSSSTGGKPAEVPNLGTELVIEDVAISIKKLRLGVALSPDQIEGIAKALQSGTTTSDGGEDGDDQSGAAASSGRSGGTSGPAGD